MTYCQPRDAPRPRDAIRRRLSGLDLARLSGRFFEHCIAERTCTVSLISHPLPHSCYRTSIRMSTVRVLGSRAHRTCCRPEPASSTCILSSNVVFSQDLILLVLYECSSNMDGETLSELGPEASSTVRPWSCSRSSPGNATVGPIGQMVTQYLIPRFLTGT